MNDAHFLKLTKTTRIRTENKPSHFEICIEDDDVAIHPEVHLTAKQALTLALQLLTFVAPIVWES